MIWKPVILLLMTAPCCGQNLKFNQSNSKWKSGVHANSQILEDGVTKTTAPSDTDFIPAPSTSFGTIDGSLVKSHTALHQVSYGGATTHSESTNGLNATTVTEEGATTAYTESASVMDVELHVPNNWAKQLSGVVVAAGGLLLEREYQILPQPEAEIANIASVEITVRLITEGLSDLGPSNLERDVRYQVTSSNGVAESFVHAKWVDDDKQWKFTYKVFDSQLQSVQLPQRPDDTPHVAVPGGGYTFSTKNGFNYVRLIRTYHSLPQTGKLQTVHTIGGTNKPFVEFLTWFVKHVTKIQGSSSGSTTSLPYDSEVHTTCWGRINIEWIRPLSQVH